MKNEEFRFSEPILLSCSPMLEDESLLQDATQYSFSQPIFVEEKHSEGPTDSTVGLMNSKYQPKTSENVTSESFNADTTQSFESPASESSDLLHCNEDRIDADKPLAQLSTKLCQLQALIDSNFNTITIKQIALIWECSACLSKNKEPKCIYCNQFGDEITSINSGDSMLETALQQRSFSGSTIGDNQGIGSSGVEVLQNVLLKPATNGIRK